MDQGQANAVILIIVAIGCFIATVIALGNIANNFIDCMDTTRDTWACLANLP